MTALVASVPASNDEVVHAGHRDRCPACVSAVVTPWAVAPRLDGSTLEHYACPACDYLWQTTWWEG